MTLPPAHRCLRCGTLVLPADQDTCPRCRADERAAERARQRRYAPRCAICWMPVYEDEESYKDSDGLFCHVKCRDLTVDPGGHG